MTIRQKFALAVLAAFVWLCAICAVANAADSKISDLTTETFTAGTDYFPMARSGANYKVLLGTAAGQATGTSGANVPLLNGNNTYSGTSTFSGTVTMSSANLAMGDNNITCGTSTGCKIGTATSQKIGFFNATPVVQQTGDAGTGLVTLGLMSGTPTFAAANLTGLGTGVGTWLATPSSANLASAIADETGSGALVFAASPTLTTPDLGTPSAATLTNATGLPISTGVSGLGTGIATALAVNTGSAGAPILFNGAGGTPSSINLSNGSSLPISGIASLGSNVGTWLATPSSSNFFSAITDETGSGAVVGGTSPTIATPSILLSDSATNGTSTIATYGHNTSGTAAAGFGSIVKDQLQTSTTANTDAANETTTWVVATHASRTARKVFNIFDTATREAFRIEASGSAPMIGFLGANAAVRQTGDVGTAAVTLGLMSGTPTFAIANLSGAGTGVLTWLATPSSANLASALTDETGSGAAVFATSPSFTTPTLGVASASKVTITAGPLLEKVVTVSDGAGAVIDASTGNIFKWSAAADRTAGTTTNPTDGQKIVIQFTASGGARTLTLPTATTGDFAYGSDITTLSQTASGKTDYIGCIYDSTAGRWRVVAVAKGY